MPTQKGSEPQTIARYELFLFDLEAVHFRLTYSPPRSRF